MFGKYRIAVYSGLGLERFHWMWRPSACLNSYGNP